MWTVALSAVHRADLPVDDGRRIEWERQTAGMSIEMPAAEVRALARELRGRSDDALEAASRLGIHADVGGSLQPALEAFLSGHRTAGRAMAGELQWLGDTISAVADSWLALDASLLARIRRPGAE
ncbi:MAG: hypothetical protein JWQ99_3678 [Blastococcus sp.]|jgi:hypothetical protein|nr:hypothetical protein [Blastococcus sp.]